MYPSKGGGQKGRQSHLRAYLPTPRRAMCRMLTIGRHAFAMAAVLSTVMRACDHQNFRMPCSGQVLVCLTV